MRLAPIALVSVLAACGSDSDDSQPIDHTKIYEVFDHDVVFADRPFAMETPTLFRTQDVLENLDVRVLAEADGVVYAGTAGGLYSIGLGGAAFDQVVDEPIVDILSSELPIAVGPDRVHLLTPNGVMSQDAPVSDITSAADTGSGMWLGTASGLFALGIEVDPQPVRDLAYFDNTVYVATSSGVARFDATTRSRLSDVEIPDQNVHAIAVNENGDLLAATSSGLYRAGTFHEAEPDGLPTDRLTAVTERDGLVMTGHAIGASVLGDKIEHYHSLRWIPDEHVTSVLIGSDGSRWIGTPAGVTRITYEETTLAEKAEYNEGLLQERHWRMDGFVDDRIRFDDEWDLSTGLHTGDHDNDGLWTQMQIGAWCYAYAVTGEERYYDSARRAMDVMMLQVAIPGVTFEAAGRSRGFITRSLVRDDEGAVFDDKATRDNWHLQEYEGRRYYWKDDTSSDEYVGHYFGVPLFYDLCAKSEEEKDELRDWARLTMDYLIDNGYVLIDLDGEPTTHGHWDNLGVAWNGLDPCIEKYGTEFLEECVGSRHGAGWLNAAEILGHLLATWHMTGEEKYLLEYERLATEEHYVDMIKIIDDTFTVTRPGIANHSDHELAMLAYITLVRYEPHLERREQYVQSLLDFYEFEREEHNPWQVGVIGGTTSQNVDIEGAVQTMKDMPDDWRTWLYDNTHRLDARSNGIDRHQKPQFDRVFPYDEIRTMKWNGSPYVKIGGGSGKGVLAPTPYLIAYWTLRYHQMIE